MDSDSVIDDGDAAAVEVVFGTATLREDWFVTARNATFVHDIECFDRGVHVASLTFAVVMDVAQTFGVVGPVAVRKLAYVDAVALHDGADRPAQGLSAQFPGVVGVAQPLGVVGPVAALNLTHPTRAAHNLHSLVGLANGRIHVLTPSPAVVVNPTQTTGVITALATLDFTAVGVVKFSNIAAHVLSLTTSEVVGLTPPVAAMRTPTARVTTHHVGLDGLTHPCAAPPTCPPAPSPRS